jgi:hypothetical protein
LTEEVVVPDTVLYHTYGNFYDVGSFSVDKIYCIYLAGKFSLFYDIHIGASYVINASIDGTTPWPIVPGAVGPTGPRTNDNLVDVVGCDTDIIALTWKYSTNNHLWLDLYSTTDITSRIASIDMGMTGSTFVEIQRVKNPITNVYYLVITYYDTTTHKICYTIYTEAGAEYQTPAPFLGTVFGVPYVLKGDVPTTIIQETLVYNYLYKTWSSDKRDATTAKIVDTDYVGSSIVKIDDLDSIHIENNDNPFFLDDAAAIPLTAKSGWLDFGNLQGFGRIYWIYLVGTFKSAYTLTVNLYIRAEGYDDSVPVQTETILTTVTNMPEKFRIKPDVQKCEAIKVEIIAIPTSLATTPLGCSLSGLDFTVGVKKGLFKLPQSKSA